MKPTNVIPQGNLFAHLAGVMSERMVLWLLAIKVSFAQSKVKRRALVIAMGILVAIASTYSVGQATQPVLPSTPTALTPGAMNSGQMVDLVITAVETEINKLRNNATLQQYGSLISGFFLIALMSWAGVKALATAKGFGDMIAEWVPIFVSFGFVYLFLNRSAPTMIEGFISSLSSAISGMPMTGMRDSMRAIVDPMFKAIFDMMSTPTKKGTWMEEIALFVPKLINGITGLIAVLLLVVGMVVSMGTIIMSFISIALAMAMAPVMVPFIMFKPTAWIFDAWLKFTIGAAVMKLVFAFVVQVAAGILAGTTSLRAQLAADKAMAMSDFIVADLIAQALLVLMCLLATFILFQTHTIATGLVGGNASGTGFSGLKGITSGTTGRMSPNVGGGGSGRSGTGGGEGGGPITRGASAAGRGYGTAKRILSKSSGTPDA